MFSDYKEATLLIWLGVEGMFMKLMQRLSQVVVI